jgi:hypothetical protein
VHLDINLSALAKIENGIRRVTALELARIVDPGYSPEMIK